jgi:hypothetical protein
MSQDIRSAFTTHMSSSGALQDLLAQLEGMEPRLIICFCGPDFDAAALSRDLRARFGDAEVVGCTSAGEFGTTGTNGRGVSLLALSERKVRRAAAAVARFDGGVAAGMQTAVDALARDLGVSLRDADPRHYVGIVLIDGLSMAEEAVNAFLGDAAPMLSFVGGSAGDDLRFKETRVFHNGTAATGAAVLVLMESAVPFAIGKTCSFKPSGRSFKVTRADEATRTVYELDGRPVLDVYSEAVGKTPADLDAALFMVNPLGLMIEGQPWIRSPQRSLEDGGLRFYCAIGEGMDVHLMESTDLVADTRAALGAWSRELGSPIAGGLAFNCILRRLELDDKDLHRPFLDSFAGMQVAGFHTYGESWLGHINQTLTGLWFA